jgi:hypothetical protein
MGNVLNQRVVAIEFEGRTVTGTYTVWSGIITVTTIHGTKTTQVGDLGSPGALDGLARIMLRELAQEGKAWSRQSNRSSRKPIPGPSITSRARQPNWSASSTTIEEFKVPANQRVRLIAQRRDWEQLRPIPGDRGRWSLIAAWPNESGLSTVWYHVPNMVPPFDETIIGFGEGWIAKNTRVVNRINSVQAARHDTRLAAAVAIRTNRRRSAAENAQGGDCKRHESHLFTHGFLLLPQRDTDRS